MNTINLISAISVLACNTSLATIPKQANPSNYGDYITINESFKYNLSSSYSGDFDFDSTNYGYEVQRYIGSYSNNAINFYSEMYYYTSYDSHYMDIMNIGTIVFFTLSIYENTVLSSFSYKPSITFDMPDNIYRLTRSYWEYNGNLSITNLANTLYFSNQRLYWLNDKDLPEVCYCNRGYIDQTSTDSTTFDSKIPYAFTWRDVSNNFNGDHGSINYCFNQSISFISTIENGHTSFNGDHGATLKYKYYINNPTYEVIDLPNVMLSILTMPFTFFSQAFNLTLFPNTPYALNVGHTILIIVGVIGSIYLIKYLVGIFKG